MTIVPVDTPDDPRVASYRDIRERDLVGRQGLFIAEGEVVLRMLARQKRHRIVSLFLAQKRLAALKPLVESLPASVPVYVAPQDVMDRVAGFPLHRGILALGEAAEPIPANTLLAGLAQRAVVIGLFGIANHDNMGGIFRNAAAFGAAAVVLDSDCCDPLYRKAIRVSVGATLQVPFARLTRTEDALTLFAAQGFAVVALSPKGSIALEKVPSAPRQAVLFGAEGPGLPTDIIERVPTVVGIGMAPGFDSLNVATASGIVLHRLTTMGR